MYRVRSRFIGYELTLQTNHTRYIGSLRKPSNGRPRSHIQRTMKATDALSVLEIRR